MADRRALTFDGTNQINAEIGDSDVLNVGNIAPLSGPLTLGGSVGDQIVNIVDGHTLSLPGDLKISKEFGSTEYATLGRGSGNFHITVTGTDAQALYLNSKKAIHQLGGQSVNEYFQVQNSVDATCFTVYGDRTSKFYGNTTFAGNVLRDGTTRSIGTSSAHWRYIYAEYFRRYNGLARTELRSGVLQTQNTGLLISGGMSLTFQIPNIFGNSVSKFISRNFNHGIRSYRGSGTGSTWLEMTFNGSDGVISTGGGNLVLAPAGGVVSFKGGILQLNGLTADPTSLSDGMIWHRSDLNTLRCRLGGTTYTINVS